METSTLETARRRPGRRLRRATLVAALSLIAAELALRALLTFELPGLAGVRTQLRRPELFSEAHEELYWTLRMAWSEAARRREPPRFDPRLGWTSRAIDDAHDHADHARVNGRRPVLLYGDSFAACVTPPTQCWQGLFEASERATDEVLVNYGVAGYGLDQILLLFESSFAHWGSERPRVVISLLLDDDLDRTRLALRGWPKPRFTWDDGVLRPPIEPVPVDGPSAVREAPPRVASYLFRWAVFGSGLAPGPLRNRVSARRSAQEETRARGRALLARLAAELEFRGLEAFVLLFQGPGCLALDGGHGGWREDLVRGELEALGLPWVLARRELRAHAEGTGQGVEAYFFKDTRRLDHMTPLGNEVAFGALLRGLDGDFDGGRD